jgi:hypothetical protein
MFDFLALPAQAVGTPEKYTGIVGLRAWDAGHLAVCSTAGTGPAPWQEGHDNPLAYGNILHTLPDFEYLPCSFMT